MIKGRSCYSPSCITLIVRVIHECTDARVMSSPQDRDHTAQPRKQKRRTMQPFLSLFTCESKKNFEVKYQAPASSLNEYHANQDIRCYFQKDSDDEGTESPDPPIRRLELQRDTDGKLKAVPKEDQQHSEKGQISESRNRLQKPRVTPSYLDSKPLPSSPGPFSSRRLSKPTFTNLESEPRKPSSREGESSRLVTDPTTDSTSQAESPADSEENFADWYRNRYVRGIEARQKKQRQEEKQQRTQHRSEERTVPLPSQVKVLHKTSKSEAQSDQNDTLDRTQPTARTPRGRQNQKPVEESNFF